MIPCQPLEMTRGPVNSVQVNPVNYMYIYSSLGQQVLLCLVDQLGQLNTNKRSACMHGTFIRPQRSVTAQQTQGIQPMLFQCWPASLSLAQH